MCRIMLIVCGKVASSLIFVCGLDYCLDPGSENVDFPRILERSLDTQWENCERISTTFLWVDIGQLFEDLQRCHFLCH